MGASRIIGLVVAAVLMLTISYWILIEVSPGLDIFWRENMVGSAIDGERYSVREDFPNSAEAADKLAQINQMYVRLITHLKTNRMNTRWARNIEFLSQNYNPTVLGEHIPVNMNYTSYTSQKGKKLRFCLRKPDDRMQFYDMNTLKFVALHELAHMATYSMGHQADFWEMFRFLLVEANSLGMINLIDYKNSHQPYCGIVVESNPVYDWPEPPK